MVITLTAESGAPDEVLVRIRKLFALSGSPNEHEAALALKKAHALLLRYNLRAEAVASGVDVHADEVTDVWLPGFGGYLWRSALLGVLANHCFCQPLRTRDQVVLIGRPTNIAAARALYAWLVPQLERLCLEEFEPLRYSGEAWPSRFCNESSRIPPSHILVACVWRSVCGVTHGSRMPNDSQRRVNMRRNA